MRSLPAQWVTLAERRGVAGSARGIAGRAGLAVTTVSRLVFEGRTTPETVQKVADVLGVSQNEIRKLAGIHSLGLGVWVPTESADRLDQPTRDALDTLIRAIVNGDHHAGNNAEKSPDAAEDRPVVIARGPFKRLAVSPPETPRQPGTGRQSHPVGEGSDPHQ